MYIVGAFTTTIAYGAAAFAFPLAPPTRDVATCTLVLLPVATMLPPATNLQVELHFDTAPIFMEDLAGVATRAIYHDCLVDGNTSSCAGPNSLIISWKTYRKTADEIAAIIEGWVGTVQAGVMENWVVESAVCA